MNPSQEMQMAPLGKRVASTCVKKLHYVDEAAVDSIPVIGPQIPNKPGQEEHPFDKRVTQYLGELPKSLSEIHFGEGRFGMGLRLMEVLEVRVISNRRKTHKMNINGTITIDSAYGISHIFRRAHSNSEVIRSMDTLTLMGPDMAAVADDYSDVKLDIKDGRREVCKGYVCFNDHNTWSDMYNRPLIGKVTGKNGTGLVTHAILRNAMLIQVEIKLPKIEVFDFELSRKTDPVKIYGRIDASITGETTRSTLTTTLFKTKHTNGVIMSNEGGIFPLSKSLMAFPLGGTVEINIHLKEHLSFDSGNSNVVQDIVQCRPKHFGNHKCKIDSKYGPIEVKLTAYPTEMHPNTFAAFKQSLRKFYK